MRFLLRLLMVLCLSFTIYACRSAEGPAFNQFFQKKRCMQAGIDAAQKAMPDIKKKIEEWVQIKTAQK